MQINIGNFIFLVGLDIYLFMLDENDFYKF